MHPRAEQSCVYDAASRPLHGEPVEEAAELVRRALATGAPARAEREEDGCRWEIVATPLRDADGGITRVLCVRRDTTEQRLAEQWAAQLRSCTQHLARSLDHEEIGFAVIHPVHSALGASASVAYLGSPVGGMRLAASRGLDPRALPSLATLPPDVPLAEVVRSGRPVFVESREELVATWPRLESPRSLEASRLQAMVGLPAVVDGRVVGAVAFSFDAPRSFDRATRHFLEAVSTQYALAVERARLFETERGARARLELLAEVSRLFSAARLDLDQVLATVCREVARCVPDTCAISLIRDGGLLELVAIHHDDPAVERSVRAVLDARPIRVGDGSGPGRVASTGAPLLVRSLPFDALRAGLPPEHRAHVERHPFHSLLVVPLRAADRVFGTLICTRGSGGPPYGPEDLELLRDLGERAALAIENARLYAEVAEARVRAESASRAKDEFLALLGHELRNPLAPILAGVRLLAARPGDEAIRDTLERQSRHMVRLVDDLLDVSRITSRKLTLQRAPVRLREVLEEAVETARPLFDEHGANVRLDASTSARVDGDRARLVQVFSNLLTNAARFCGPCGQVEVAARADGPQVVVHVRDHGEGMDAELLPRVFELFAQGSSGRGRGLGLGLAIVRSLVEMHGGRVEAHSDGPGEGSTFTVVLPAADETAPPPPVRAPRGAPAGRRVLVVDDNRDAADLLASLLRLEGQEVEVAYDAATALELASRILPDVAFVDIGLPDLDGWALARRLAALPNASSLRLVALSGYSLEADRDRSREAGFWRHLVKPLDPDELESLLAELSRNPHDLG